LAAGTVVAVSFPDPNEFIGIPSKRSACYRYWAKRVNEFWPNGRIDFGQMGEHKKNFRVFASQFKQKIRAKPIRIPPDSVLR
jgi:hypothetical protein